MLVICMVTMTLGNLAALNQQNVKRLLAYSSIAHAGYMLMGFVVLNDDGLRAMLFYLVTYYLMNIGAFLVVMVVVNSTGREDIEGFRGLAWRGGAVPAVAMAIFLFSLAGLPPLAGFVGKFYLFAAVVKAAVLSARAGRPREQPRRALLLRAHRADDVPRHARRRARAWSCSTRTTPASSSSWPCRRSSSASTGRR